MLMKGEEIEGTQEAAASTFLRTKNGSATLLVAQLLTKQMVKRGQCRQRHYDEWEDSGGVVDCIIDDASWRNGGR